jgi:hypothetical protein
MDMGGQSFCGESSLEDGNWYGTGDDRFDIAANLFRSSSLHLVSVIRCGHEANKSAVDKPIATSKSTTTEFLAYLSPFPS